MTNSTREGGTKFKIRSLLIPSSPTIVLFLVLIVGLIIPGKTSGVTSHSSSAEPISSTTEATETSIDKPIRPASYDDDSEEGPEIDLDRDFVLIPHYIDLYLGPNFYIGVGNAGTDTLEWTIEKTGNWFSAHDIITDEETGAGVIVIETTTNPTMSPRIGEITVTSSNASNSPKTITVYQDGNNYPDVIAHSLSGPSSVKTGDQVELTVNIRNEGLVEAIAGWDASLFLAKYRRYPTPEAVMANKEFPVTLEPGEEYEWTVQVTIPGGVPSGEYYFAIDLDINNELNEKDADINNSTGGNLVTLQEIITVEIPGTTGQNGWRFLGTSRTDETYADLLEGTWTQGAVGATTGSGAPNILVWDEPAQQFSAVTDLTQTIPNESGFIAYLYEDDAPTQEGIQGGWPKTLESSGAGQSGEVAFPISYSEGENSYLNGFNLVSNPYSKSIDWEAASGWTKTDINDAIYIWDPNANGGYGAYKVRVDGFGDPINIIAPYQAFFVQASGENAALSVTEEAQAEGGTLLKDEPADTTRLLYFKLETEGFEDKTYLRFSSTGKESMDREDAVQLEPFSSKVMELYSLSSDGNILAVNSLPKRKQEYQIPIDINTTQNGSFTLSWERSNIPFNWNIKLQDRVSGREIDLNLEQQYIFDISSSSSRKETSERFGKNDNWTSDSDKESRFLLKISPANSSISAGPLAELPAEFQLNQNYPNPFNPSTVIRFGLPQSSSVNIKVYNIIGQEVATLVNEQMDAGYHKVNFEAGGLSSGVYVYRLQTDGFSETRKMLIIK